METKTKRKSNSFQSKTKKIKTDKEKETKIIEKQLSYSTITPGSLFLGCISSITKNGFSISLPNSLVGYVKLKDIGENMNEELLMKYHEGEFVIVLIIEIIIGNEKQVFLTMKPSLIYSELSGYVVKGLYSFEVISKEDHGYRLVGAKNYNIFLPNENCEREYAIGEIVLGSVTKVASKIITISCQKAVLKKDSIKSNTITYSDLFPGFKFNGTILNVKDSVISVTLPNNHIGKAHYFHALSLDPSELKMLEPNQSYKVRIIYIDHNEHILFVSFRKHIRMLKTYKPELEFGDVIEDATVKYIDSYMGCVLSVPPNIFGFCKRTNASDVPISKMEKVVALDEVHKCRIIGSNLFDGFLQFTLSPSLIESKILSIKNLSCDMLLTVSILKITQKCLLCSIAPHLNGLIPNSHMTDLPSVSNPLTFFKIGQKLKVKVFNIDPIKHIVLLTNKKTLINSKYNHISTLEAVKAGDQAHGVVSTFNKSGMLVRFYNNISGLVPLSVLRNTGISNPETVFSKGQILLVSIVEVNPTTKRLILVLDKKNGKIVQLTLGTVYQATIEEVIQEPKGLIVLYNKMCRCFVPYPHFSDHIPHYELFWKYYSDKIGEVISIMPVSYLTNHESKCTILATMKASLISPPAPALFPVNYSSLSVGNICCGYIQKLEEYGVIIHFGGNVKGLVLKSELSDYFVKNVSDFYQLNQSVLCSVLEIDTVNNKLLLSLKQSKLSANSNYVTQLYHEQYSLLKGNEILNYDNFPVGATISGKVLHNKEYGIILSLANNVVGVALKPYHTYNIGAEIGSDLSCSVLAIDQTKQIVYVTLRKEYLNIETQINKTIEKTIRNKEGINAVVLHKQEDDVMIVSIPQFNNAFSIVSMINYNELQSKYNDLEIGSSIPIVLISECKQSSHLLIFGTIQSDFMKDVTYHQHKKHLHSMQRSRSLLPSTNLQVNEIYKAKIIAIYAQHMTIGFTEINNYQVKARIHISQFIHNTNIQDKHPFDGYGEEDLITVKVLKIQDVGENKCIECKLLSEMNQNDNQDVILEWDNIVVGEQYKGIITDVKNHEILLSLSPLIYGVVIPQECSNNISINMNVIDNFLPGQIMSCRVLTVDAIKRRLMLSFLEEDKKANVKVGDLVYGNIIDKNGLENFPKVNILIGHGIYGTLSCINVSDPEHFVSHPFKNYVADQFIKARIIGIDSDGKYILSSRDSILSYTGNLQELIENEDKSLNVGDLIHGFIEATTKKGTFLQITPTVIGHIMLKNLHDIFVVDCEKDYPSGMLVVGKILSITSNVKIELSLKPSDVMDAKDRLQFENLEINSVCTAIIRQIKPFGLFLRLDNSILDCLCHISEVSDNTITENELVELHHIGDKVRVIINGLDPIKKRISCSMKHSKFEGLNVTEEIIEPIVEAELEEDEDEIEDIEEEDLDMNSGNTMEFDLWGNSLFSQAKPIQGNDMEIDNSESDSGAEEEEKGKSKTHSTHKTLSQKRQREAIISEIEQTNLNNTLQPQSEDDFEKLIVATPRSSFIWLKFASYLINLTEFDKARRVFKRALDTIPAGLEDEKFNIWIGYINLEFKYGTSDTLDEIVKLSVAQCPSEKIYLHLFSLYVDDKNYEKAETTIKKALKKHKENTKLWEGYICLNYAMNNYDGANKIILQVLQQKLVKRDETVLLLSCVKYLYQHQEFDRARDLGETVIQFDPKRCETWNLLTEWEIKSDHPEEARRLFERAISVKMSKQNMRFLFKKYLQFETEYGDENLVSAVKTLITQYTHQIADT